MREKNLTPAEQEKILKRICGSGARLSRPGDPELSCVAISFYPTPLKSNKKEPPKKVRRKVKLKKKTKPA